MNFSHLFTCNEEEDFVGRLCAIDLKFHGYVCGLLNFQSH